jgi:hypothetical protein
LAKIATQTGSWAVPAKRRYGKLRLLQTGAIGEVAENLTLQELRFRTDDRCSVSVSKQKSVSRYLATVAANEVDELIGLLLLSPLDRSVSGSWLPVIREPSMNFIQANLAGTIVPQTLMVALLKPLRGARYHSLPRFRSKTLAAQRRKAAHARHMLPTGGG